MHRASNAFSVLQATAATLGIAMILWSVGLPSLRFAEAANVTSFSDTLSTSQSSVAANHTIEYVATNGVAASESIVLVFEAGDFNLDAIGEEDVDLLEGGVAESVGTNWTVSTSTDTITITSAGAGGVIAAGATTTILIGTHATNDGTPDGQIINPTQGSYTLDVSSGSQDTGETRVAIVDTVLVTASVDTLFSFTVTGVDTNEPVNTADTTGGSTTATSIPFGVLEAGTASTAAQDLTVTTNSRSGFVVTVQTDQQLSSANGADIDGFIDGAYTETPVAWQNPGTLVSDENTYGHWGITTDDATVGSNDFNVGSGGDRYVSASTTPVEIFNHNGPTDGTGNGEGTTRVGYKVQISSLQEAADDYQAVLTYIATPVF